MVIIFQWAGGHRTLIPRMIWLAGKLNKSWHQLDKKNVFEQFPSNMSKAKEQANLRKLIQFICEMRIRSDL